ncbi:MAG: hypothetical protein L6R40_003522 [Gallowayella cf. fulva]|nr:MAG: hypothetical protein L6R40_003522 [Xanthomendoza cf. fulva]
MATTRESVDGVADGVSQVVKLAFPQFLVALFVVKTRAPAKTVRGMKFLHSLQDYYLAEIRSYIRTGHRPETDSDGARYIDTLEFWKNSHHRLQHEANERIYTRERKPDASRLVETGPLLRQDGEIPPIIHGKGRGIKRKRATVTAIHPETGKQKAVHVPAFPITGSQPSASSSASDASLPNAIYALQNSISASPINPSTTASIILFIISTLRAWFVVANNPFHHGKSPNTLQPTTKGPSSDITRELPSRDESLDSTTARTLFPLVYTAIGRLDDNTNSRFYQNQLIYEIIRLLKDILEQIHHLAGSLSTMKLSHSKNSTAVVPSPPKKPRRSARFGGQNAALSPDQPPPLQQPQLDPKTPANNNDSAIQTLCNILIYAVEALHPEIRPTDGTIEEGWLFFLLQRTSEVIKAAYSTIINIDDNNNSTEFVREARAEKNQGSASTVSNIVAGEKCLMF